MNGSHYMNVCIPNKTYQPGSGAMRPMRRRESLDQYLANMDLRERVQQGLYHVKPVLELLHGQPQKRNTPNETSKKDPQTVLPGDPLKDLDALREKDLAGGFPKVEDREDRGYTVDEDEDEE